jgi:hypothetical protein
VLLAHVMKDSSNGSQPPLAAHLADLNAFSFLFAMQLTV